MREKGVTNFDKMCHKIYEANGDGIAYYARETGIRCEHCGHDLEAYYCEDRLYVVRCRECKTITLVEASSPISAAHIARGAGLYAAGDMDWEAPAVFWDSCPPEDMPDYVGTLNDRDFPEDIKVGMYLPIPATDGEGLVDRLKELEEENDEGTD